MRIIDDTANTLHDPVVVDVGVMAHYRSSVIKVIHLGIDGVYAWLCDHYCTHLCSILNAALLIFDTPSRYALRLI